MTETPAKKRDEPARAAPLLRDGIRYLVRHTAAPSWGSDPLPDVSTTELVAERADDGTQLWCTRLFDVHFDPQMERDKQEIHVTSLSFNLFGTKLKAIDEKGRKYLVDLKTHALSA